MRQEIRNNGLGNMTVIVADEGKELFCKYHNKNEGKEIWLGDIYLGPYGERLIEPHKHVPEDFIEIDEVKK